VAWATRSGSVPALAPSELRSSSSFAFKRPASSISEGQDTLATRAKGQYGTAP
jgi:hypothetical protein